MMISLALEFMKYIGGTSNINLLVTESQPEKLHGLRK
ncbi:hypothetical protein AVEN_140413-1, partial [Araneus ventricosus]